MANTQQLQAVSYTWNITDQTLVTRIKTAKPGQKFKSPVFTMFNFRWFLVLWPNGQTKKSTGKTQIYLTLVTFSGNVKSMRVARKYTFVELDVVREAINTVTHKHMYTTVWPAGSVNFQDIQNCSQFTLKVDVELFAVLDKDDNDITNRYLQNEEVKTDSPASPHDMVLKTAILDSIVMQMKQMNTKISAMQQKIITIELRLNAE
eukprot:961552_1